MYRAIVLKTKMICSSCNIAATKSLNKIRLFSSFMVYLGTLLAYKEHRTRNIPQRGGRPCMAGCRGLLAVKDFSTSTKHRLKMSTI
jgi:hypothetical protein